MAVKDAAPVEPAVVEVPVEDVMETPEEVAAVVEVLEVSDENWSVASSPVAYLRQDSVATQDYVNNPPPLVVN